jgi:membrane protease YdiL (CAAX protease family)
MGVGKEFVILFAVMFLPGMLTQSAGVDPASWDRISYHIAVLAVAVPQTFLVVYVSGLRTPGIGARLGWRRPSWSDGLTAVLATAGLLAAISLMSLIVALAGSPGDALEPVVNWSFTRMALLPLALLTSLAVGYREEIFYRSYLVIRGEELGLKRWIIAAGSSLLFAAGHLYQGLAGFVVALVIGLVLCVVFMARRSLHGIAIAHGVYNTLVLLASSRIDLVQ